MEGIFRSYSNFISGEAITQYIIWREYFAVIQISLTVKQSPNTLYGENISQLFKFH